MPSRSSAPGERLKGMSSTNTTALEMNHSVKMTTNSYDTTTPPLEHTNIWYPWSSIKSATRCAPNRCNSWWTTTNYPILFGAPIRNKSVLEDYVIDGNDPELSGSKKSVAIISGNKVCTCYVQVRGRRFGGVWKFPLSQYFISYRSKLEGITLTLKAVSETATSDGIK